eukprot:jgi/Botrbrau1/6566/Bobra.40_2s0030.1
MGDQVVYSKRMARLLHTLPLLMALSAPLHLRGTYTQSGMPRVYWGMLVDAGHAAMAMTAGVLLPAVQGIVRVALTGKPLAWFGTFSLPYLMYVPVTVAGALAVYLPGKKDPVLATLGLSVWAGFVACLLTVGLGLGSGFIFAVWSMAALLCTWLVPMVSKRVRPWVALVLAGSVAALFMPGGGALSLHVLQKAGYLGSAEPAWLQPFVADAALGILVGASALSTLGFLLPWLAASWGPRLKGAIAVLLLLSCAAGVVCQTVFSAYADQAPKKIFLQHLHEIGEGGEVQRSSWTAASIDSVPVQQHLPSTLTWTPLPRHRSPWLAIHPVSTVLQSCEAEGAPGPSEALGGLTVPEMHKIARESLSEDLVRLQLRLVLPREGMFGALEFDGPLVSWSFASGRSKPWQGTKVVRFAGVEGSNEWIMAVDLPVNASVQVRTCAATAEVSSDIDELALAFPPYVSLSSITTWCLKRTFAARDHS